MVYRVKYLAQDGRFLHGIPARDLTEADWALLSDEQQAQVAAAGDLYEIVPVKKSAKRRSQSDGGK